jgi:hypothetical protein
MGASQAIPGYGTVLTMGGNPVAELTSITPPVPKADSIDTSNFSSPNHYREAIGGFIDAGEATLEGNYIGGDTLGQVAMMAARDTGTPQAFIITLVDGTTCAFTAVVLEAGPATINFDGKVNFSARLKVSGASAWTVTLSANITALTYEDSVGVKTSLPVFAAGTLGPYTVTINTASGYVKVTVTQATATTIIAECLGVQHNLTTTVQSGQITVGAAATTTLLTITVTDTGKAPKTYTIYVVRP